MAKQEKITVNQFRAMQREILTADEKQAGAKYNNRYCIVDGKTFQSQKEAKYYGQCKIMVKAGIITGFEMQKKYSLCVNGHRITSYRADFVLHYPDGRQEVIDVKSDVTRQIPLYQIKKALMLAVHGITIIEK